MSADEFLQLPEELAPAQLIQGLMIRDPAPAVSHQELIGRLYLILHQAIREPGHGYAYLAPVAVVLDTDTVLEPDLVVIAQDRRDIIGERISGAPDLVIEVSSPSTAERDLTAKRLLYARYGVREYWFVSGADRTLTRFLEPEQDRFRQAICQKSPGRVRSTIFPELAVDLMPLFQDFS